MFETPEAYDAWLLSQPNKDLLSDLETLQVKFTELKSFLDDPDIQAVLDQPNATPLTTQQQNKAMKEMVRQLRRITNFQIRLARYVFSQENPELLNDVSDT